ncbi:MAG: A24 family peptidase, partial [Dehalococcoidia bacterium]
RHDAPHRYRTLLAACLGAVCGALVLILAPAVREPMLLAALAMAALVDLRTRRVPNWLTAAGSTFALASAAAAPGVLLGGGVAAAVGVAMLLTARGAYGVGDVKAMGVAGATVGLAHVLPLLFWMAMAGGVGVLVLALRARRLRGETMPYAPAIAAGAALALLLAR